MKITHKLVGSHFLTPSSVYCAQLYAGISILKAIRDASEALIFLIFLRAALSPGLICQSDDRSQAFGGFLPVDLS